MANPNLAAVPPKRTAAPTSNSTPKSTVSLATLGYLEPDQKCGTCLHFDTASGLCDLAAEHVDHNGVCPKHKYSAAYASHQYKTAQGEEEGETQETESAEMLEGEAGDPNGEDEDEE